MARVSVLVLAMAVVAALAVAVQAASSSLLIGRGVFVCAEALWLVTGPSRCHPSAGIYDMTGPASDGKRLLFDCKCVSESDSISPLPEQSTLWAMQTPSKWVAAFTFVNVLVHSSLATPPPVHALSLSRSMPAWAPRPSRLQSLRSSQYVKEGGRHCWNTRHDTQVTRHTAVAPAPAHTQTIYGDLYTAENVGISGIHTHSTPGGFLQYVLFDITSLGFVKQVLALVVHAHSQPRRTNPIPPCYPLTVA